MNASIMKCRLRLRRSNSIFSGFSARTGEGDQFEELFEKVWHEKYYKNSNNTVMVHIRHLREKMNAPTGKSDFIKTVWGVGYKVEE